MARAGPSFHACISRGKFHWNITRRHYSYNVQSSRRQQKRGLFSLNILSPFLELYTSMKNPTGVKSVLHHNGLVFFTGILESGSSRNQAWTTNTHAHIHTHTLTVTPTHIHTLSSFSAPNVAKGQMFPLDFKHSIMITNTNCSFLSRLLALSATSYENTWMDQHAAVIQVYHTAKSLYWHLLVYW